MPYAIRPSKMDAGCMAMLLSLLPSFTPLFFRFRDFLEIGTPTHRSGIGAPPPLNFQKKVETYQANRYWYKLNYKDTSASITNASSKAKILLLVDADLRPIMCIMLNLFYLFFFILGLRGLFILFSCRRWHIYYRCISPLIALRCSCLLLLLCIKSANRLRIHLWSR